MSQCIYVCKIFIYIYCHPTNKTYMDLNYIMYSLTTTTTIRAKGNFSTGRSRRHTVGAHFSPLNDFHYQDAKQLRNIHINAAVKYIGEIIKSIYKYREIYN